MLFVVQDPEIQAFDQRQLEHYLLDMHRVQTLRITLSEIAISAKLDCDYRLLLSRFTNEEDTQEISVVYLRSGFGPKDYPSDRE